MNVPNFPSYDEAMRDGWTSCLWHQLNAVYELGESLRDATKVAYTLAHGFPRVSVSSEGQWVAEVEAK